MSTRSEKVALWWTSSSTIWALVILVLVILRSRQQAGGFSVWTPAGLVAGVTGALAVLGLAGVALWKRGHRLACPVLVAYSLLWTASLGSVLSWVWSAEAEWSVCLKGVNVCITAWWARVLLAGALVPFGVLTMWFGSRLTNKHAVT
jgi:hypothetical protein